MTQDPDETARLAHEMYEASMNIGPICLQHATGPDKYSVAMFNPSAAEDGVKVFDRNKHLNALDAVLSDDPPLAHYADFAEAVAAGWRID